MKVVFLFSFSILICGLMFIFFGRSGLKTVLFYTVLLNAIYFLGEAISHWVGPNAQTVYYCLFMVACIVLSLLKHKKRKVGKISH